MTPETNEAALAELRAAAEGARPRLARAIENKGQHYGSKRAGFWVDAVCLEDLVAIVAALEAAEARISTLEEALEPFAKMARLVDGPCGPRGGGGTPDDGPYVSGGAWTENGAVRTITWGDLRRARALLSTPNAAPVPPLPATKEEC